MTNLARKHFREVRPDVRYNSAIVQKLINYVMKNGEKATAESIVYESIPLFFASLSSEIIANTSPIDALKKAIDNVSPGIEVVSKRVRGSTYQVPVDISVDRSRIIALQLIIKGTRNNRTMSSDIIKNKADARKLNLKTSVSLARELIDAFNNRGFAFKKMMEIRATASSNRAFAHLARGGKS